VIKKGGARASLDAGRIINPTIPSPEIGREFEKKHSFPVISD